MPCPAPPGKDAGYFFGLSVYCIRVQEVLLDFCEGKKVEDFPAKIESAADLIIQLGADFVPEFKRIVREQNDSWPTYGFGTHKSHIEYEHFLAFKNVVQKNGCQDRVAEIRSKLLSLLDPSVKAGTKKKNAEACRKFFDSLWSECNWQYNQITGF